MTTKVSKAMASTDFATAAQVAAVRALFVGTILEFPFVPSDPWWLPCFGQTLQQADYPALALKFGVTSGTFTLPDHRGRVVAGADNMGGTSANRLTGQSGGVDGDVLGAVGGSEVHTLTPAQMPSHTHAVTGTTNTTGAHTHAIAIASGTGGSKVTGGASGGIGVDTASIASNGDHSHTVTGTAAATGADTAHNNVQPTIIQNKYILAY